jgi:predicted RND superfamily exporter protein
MQKAWACIREMLVGWSMDHPRAVLALFLVLTAASVTRLPRMRTDTDPKSMLPITSPVRQYNDQVEGWFGLHPDVIVVGVASDEGIFVPGTLARVGRLSDAITRLPGVIARDVVSLRTVNDVSVATDGALGARPILDRAPLDVEEARRLERRVLGNALVQGRLISADAKTTAMYVPIEPRANGKLIADRIKELAAAEPGPERYFVSGDPVARHGVGAEMFRQRQLFAPLAGLVMSLILFLLFRNLWAVGINLLVALVAVISSMGLFSALGVPIHILASMGPIFLIAISTDTVHIFNELAFRRGEVGTRREAIRQTMETVGAPVLFSDLTTIAGFASLAIGPIVPVHVFRLLVAFGTSMILLMSFTLVPALLMLGRDRWVAARAEAADGASPWLAWLGRTCVARRKPVAWTGAILLVIAVLGLFQIRVNNNLLSFFKYGSDIRVADRYLSRNLGGTAPLYLVAEGKTPDTATQPEFLRALDELQRSLERDPVVGKTVSLADVVKRIHRVLHGDDPAQEIIPDSQDEVAQYLLLFSMAARPRDLDNLVDNRYEKANLVVQLRSWDAVATKALLGRVQDHLAAHPLPGAEVKPAGMAYFNMVWSDEVLVGMLEGFVASCILVLVLLVLDYRSLRWGLVSFLPLLFTVVLCYGAVGFAGKDFDMPVSVLSTMTLGLAVDFAIHFVSRFQQRYRETGDLEQSLIWTVARPGRGIVRNALLFAAGFSVMLFSALSPYITVGVSMIAIMLLSALSTLIYLPALIALLHPRPEGRLSTSAPAIALGGAS